MSIASRLPILVGMVLGSSVSALACSSSSGDTSYAMPSSQYCKTLDDEARALPECSHSVCSGEKTISISGEEVCTWEKRFKPGFITPLDCRAWCGEPAEDESIGCTFPDADMDRLRLTWSNSGGASCPFAAKVERQQVTCQLLVRTGGRNCAVEGRRPAGWSATGGAGDNALGAYFAACAELEAISVDAFRELAAELAFHGAPSALVERCEQAAREEIVHASLVGDLARRFGSATPAITRVPRTDPRPLVDIAVENAVEGCVRELFGAAQARVRASCARDPEIRAVMTRIADDEARHADLSVAIGAYLDGRLDAAERARVHAAMVEARRELRAEIARAEVDPELEERAGVPSREVALALFDVVTTTFSRPEFSVDSQRRSGDASVTHV